MAGLETLFEFRGLSYAVGGGRRVTVSGAVAPGQVLLVQGASGSGKTTLLRVLARLTACLQGEVILAGESWLSIPPGAWRTEVHYVAQKPALFDGSVAANLVKPFETRLVRSHKSFAAEQARTLLADLRLPGGIWDQDARTLSGGEAARVALVRALVLAPRVLLLDEPGAALDPRSREALYRVLAGWLAPGGRVALLVTHDAGLAPLDKVSVMNIEGRKEQGR